MIYSFTRDGENDLQYPYAIISFIDFSVNVPPQDHCEYKNGVHNQLNL